MKILHASEKKLTFGPGIRLLQIWWQIRWIIMQKNNGLQIASSVCFDFKEAQVCGDSLLEVCMDTYDQIIYIPVTQQGWACCRQGIWTKMGIFCNCFLWILHAGFWLDSRAESKNLHLVSVLRHIHCPQWCVDSREEKKSRFTCKKEEIQVKSRSESVCTRKRKGTVGCL